MPSPPTKALRHAMRTRPRATATAFGLACAITLLAAAELGLRLQEHRAVRSRPAPVETSFAEMIALDELYGFRLAGPRRVADTARRGRALIYEVHYAIDAQGRRRAPARDLPRDAPLLLTLGCSVAFGLGVNDHETLGAQAAARVADAQTLNFAAPAYGPQHAWLQLRDPDFTNDLRGRRGLAVYVFGDHHLHRLAGSGGLPPGWRGRLPWLEMRRGVVIHHGLFADRDAVRPQAPALLRGLRLYEAVECRLARARAIAKPEVEAADATEHFAQTMAECAAFLRAVAPEMEFRVLLFPGVHFVNRVGTALAERGVGVLNYSGCAPPDWTEETMYHHDAPDGGPGHPKPALHAYVGAQLARDFQWILGRDTAAPAHWSPGYCNPRADDSLEANEPPNEQ